MWSCSKLSVDAKEFFPASWRTTRFNDSSKTKNPGMVGPQSGLDANAAAQNMPEIPNESETGTSSAIDAVGILRFYIEELTLDPGQYEDTAGELEEQLAMSIHDEATVRNIVEELLHQSIRKPNFRYSGARLSMKLCTSLHEMNFRKYFLQRCNFEFKRTAELITTNEGQQRVTGFALFLGELLLNMRLETGDSITIFHQATFSLLNSLLSVPNDNTVRCISQILKLTGSTLETSEHGCPEMDSLFDRMKSYIVDQKSSRSHRQILLNLIALRAKDWERASAFDP